MQTIRNIIISIGVCLIGLLFVACSGSPQSAQVSQATPEATAIERSASEATATKKPTIKVTASQTRTASMPSPTRRPTNTAGSSPTLNTKPVADLLGLPTTLTTSPRSEQTGSTARIVLTSPDGRYQVSVIDETGFDILDEERVRSYRFPYKFSDFVFSPDSDQLAFQVYLNIENYAVLIVDLEDGVLRQAFHSSQWPNYTRRKLFGLQEWNAAGIVLRIIDMDVGNQTANYELFDPTRLAFETIGSGYPWETKMSHNAQLVMQTRLREHPRPHDSFDTDLFLIDRENNSEQFIDEGVIIFVGGFSSDDRYFVYIHSAMSSDEKDRIKLLELDTLEAKELVLEQGRLGSIEWYGEEQAQQLLLTVEHEGELIKYVVPIDNFDLDHLTPLSTP
jgi:hypothetical protein